MGVEVLEEVGSGRREGGGEGREMREGGVVGLLGAAVGVGVEEDAEMSGESREEAEGKRETPELKHVGSAVAKAQNAEMGGGGKEESRVEAAGQRETRELKNAAGAVAKHQAAAAAEVEEESREEALAEMRAALQAVLPPVLVAEGRIHS